MENHFHLLMKKKPSLWLMYNWIISCRISTVVTCTYLFQWEGILITGENLLEELTLEQWAAIYGIEPMTQTLFDSIQLERLKAWEELESAALDTFLKYPEFALNYSSRLENALSTSNTISSDDTEENFKKLYEKMRHSTYEKFQYDIGA